MKIQTEAVHALTESLIGNPLVKAIILKGSLGRGEGDDFSDVDLYCFVEKEDTERFLKDRIRHLEAYRPILFYEDCFIIAPQIIAVYDNLLHVDLFTVTEETFKTSDFFEVLYDPHDIMGPFVSRQHLTLSEEEFEEEAYGVAWFLFQYRKACKRGNDVWAVELLHAATKSLAKVVLHQYRPDRAQLGLKCLEKELPDAQLSEFRSILSKLTPVHHKQAADEILLYLEREGDWLEETLGERSYAKRFLMKIQEVFREEFIVGQREQR
ncbi:nucleotidyltransferase domain-containing protein [Jeotgalibacillus aurantiacus]|uniref:nucleotidyltransferase domain-containing protein n=1 Tax=Jeotgalibacillus aurantiacus TaxID=2763266 RepID=UPI001D0BD398|nr:nucleotidyltransferase domain-containing protein [Jeotgalibacillus aurantiacus]